MTDAARITVTEHSGIRVFDAEGNEVARLLPDALLFQHLSVELGRVALALTFKG